MTLHELVLCIRGLQVESDHGAYTSTKLGRGRRHKMPTAGCHGKTILLSFMIIPVFCCCGIVP